MRTTPSVRSFRWGFMCLEILEEAEPPNSLAEGCSAADGDRRAGPCKRALQRVQGSGDGEAYDSVALSLKGSEPRKMPWNPAHPSDCQELLYGRGHGRCLARSLRAVHQKSSILTFTMHREP